MRTHMHREGPPFDLRLFNGASLGLAVPYLRGDEVVATKGMTPRGDFAVRLPGGRPKVVVGYRGRPLPVDLVPHTIAVLVDERLVSLVWRASAVLPSDFVSRMPTHQHPEVTGLEDLEIMVAPA